MRFGPGLGRVWRLGNGGRRHSSSCCCSFHRGGGSHKTADGGSRGDSRAAAEYPQLTQAPAITPAPTKAPEPAPVPTVEPTDTPEPLPETYPLEIRDMIGRPVTIPAKPARIVSINPTAAEISRPRLSAMLPRIPGLVPFAYGASLFRWWDASSFPDATSKRNQPGKASRTAQHRAMPSTPPNSPVPDNSCG